LLENKFFDLDVIFCFVQLNNLCEILSQL